MGATDRGPNPHPDRPLPFAVTALAALPRIPGPVPTSWILLPALSLPRRVDSPMGPYRRLPPAGRAPWPPALVLALPVPLPAPAAARAFHRHRAGTGAVGRGRAPGVRAAAAGSEGSHEDAATCVRGGGGADDCAQHRDHHGDHARALLGQAWPHLSHYSGSGGTGISTAPSSIRVTLCMVEPVAGSSWMCTSVPLTLTVGPLHAKGKPHSCTPAVD